MSSSPSRSDGEISEDRSEKPKPFNKANKGTHGDRQAAPPSPSSRHRAGAAWDHGRKFSRKRSRSPYDHHQRYKRGRDDDYSARNQRDHRQSKIHDDDSAYRLRRSGSSHRPEHEGTWSKHGIGRPSKARSPPGETHLQSVSSQVSAPSDNTFLKHNAEQLPAQAHLFHIPTALSRHDSPANKSGASPDLSPSDNLSDAELIEQRRKRREAIKLKHRVQTTPAPEDLDTSKGASMSADVIGPMVDGDDGLSRGSPLVQPAPPQDALRGVQAPLDVAEDSELMNQNATSDSEGQQQEPSAADYDPTVDMQEDRIRQVEHVRNEGKANGHVRANANVQVDSEVARAPEIENGNAETAADDFDMFAEDDMFVPSTNNQVKANKNGISGQIHAQGLDAGMLDDFDDPDGYYKIILGERLDCRYLVQSVLGKGMFSAVIRALDQSANRLVAIKIIRNNETMKKAGMQEIEILQNLIALDPEDKKHVIRLERYFEHKGHLCMVFEHLSINLREVLKKFGRDVGINLKAVRAYAQQMFAGLALMRKANVLHADLKPDNMLVNEARNMLKICDLGSACEANKGDITPYLVSRFYRAPEIILGMPYDFAIDMWSIGCTLFELYTGKILFTGRSNNQMLRAIMECRGKISVKSLKKAHFAGLHFDDMMNFKSLEKDRITGRDVVRLLNFAKPTRDLKMRILVNVKAMSDAEVKELNTFVDLLDRCLQLNPERRCTPLEALKHPFFSRSK